MEHCLSLDDPKASLSGCFELDDNLVKSCLFFHGTAFFEQLINIARFFEMGMFVRVCGSACVRVCIIQSNRSRITYILPFPISYSTE